MNSDRVNLAALSDEDQEVLTSWLAVIGLLVMQWSPIERRIDQCVHLLYKSFVSLKPKRKPLKLSDKLEFIKKNIHPDIINSQSLECLITLTLSTVRTRDVCVHGVLSFYDKNKMWIGKVNGKSEQHVIENFPFDRERLEHSATNLNFLQKEWGSTVDALLASSTNRQLPPA